MHLRGNESMRRSIWILLFACVAPLSAAVRETGVDVSHYQGSSGVSQSTWNSVKSAGATFAYIKASEGLTGPDDTAMSNNVFRASTAGLLTGVYHYAHPENRNNAAGAVAEADHLLDYAGLAIGDGHLRPAIDIEGSALNLSKTDLTTWIINFCAEIVAQKGSAAMPILYMSQSSAASEVDNRLANYDAWIAAPGSSEPSAGVFKNWTIWQNSFNAVNGSLSSDGDVMHSEMKTLASLVVPEPTTAFLLMSLPLLALRRRVQTASR